MKVSLRCSRKGTLLELSRAPAFMSVEGGDVTKLVNLPPLLTFFSSLVLDFYQDLTGKVLDSYHFDRLMVHDVAVSPDGERLIGVGTLLSSGDGLQPSRCRAEKGIIGKRPQAY